MTAMGEHLLLIQALDNFKAENRRLLADLAQARQRIAELERDVKRLAIRRVE